MSQYFYLTRESIATYGDAGAYSDSRGIPGVRKEVAEFILKRDGYPR